MSTPQTCGYCTTQAHVTRVREEHGLGSPQHRAALEGLRPYLEPMRLGKAHSADCPERIATPMVRFL